MIETAFENNVSMKLSRAMLLYEGDGRSFATVHGIFTDHRGDQKIGEGSPVNIAMLATLTEKLGRNTAIGGYIPAHILSVGLDSLVWWVKPAPRRVFFKTNEKIIGERSAVVPHPGLVFGINSSGAWSVCAVEGNDRPLEDTPLFQAPYFNVWEGGNICRGTVDVPKSISAGDTAQWEECFFSSNFVHPNVHTPMRLLNRKSGPYQFWKSMLDGKHKTFPKKALVPTGGTLKDFIKKISGGKA